MNLLIDSGNTFTKVALCSDTEIMKVIKINDLQDFNFVNNKYSPENLIISSVNKDAHEIVRFFPSSKKIILDSSTPVPINNLYKTPHTLGMDRLAGVVAATVLHKGYPCLCIDAGTCITYDIIDGEANYFGGSISPGLEMRFKALHTFTARLPLVQRHEKEELTGQSTETSIVSGVQIGTLKEVEGVINEYKSKHKDLKIIITGGDISFFESRIKDTIFAVPDLLFLGLKRILEYNV